MYDDDNRECLKEEDTRDDSYGIKRLYIPASLVLSNFQASKDACSLLDSVLAWFPAFQPMFTLELSIPPSHFL